jgi:membrane fusion protein, multidrug efflux system
MSQRRQAVLLLAVVGVVAAALFAGFLFGRSGRAGGEPEDEAAIRGEPVAQVTTAPAERRRMERLVLAYGAVVPAPDAVQSVAAPFECRVRSVLAFAGQRVEAGQPLLEIAPSPEAALRLAEERSNRESAKADLEQVRQRAELQLATKGELLKAEQTLDLAQLRLDSLRKGGQGVRRVTSSTAGLLSRMNVREGDLVPPFGVLAELVPGDSIEVRLGADPGDLDQLRPGQPVHLAPVIGGRRQPLEGRVRLITEEINPVSRLVDVYITVPDAASLPLDTYVVGRIVVDAKEVLAVPRAAVQPEGENNFLYTVAGGRAQRRDVGLGLEDGDWVEITDGGIAAGQRVVVVGNYELADGMTVAEGRPK